MRRYMDGLMQDIYFYITIFLTGGIMKTHKDLDIWKLAIELVVKIYKKTKNFPKEEMYGLTSQLRRAAVSVASNIAEGAARNSIGEYIRFV